jgi:hypothetical protein
MSIVGRGIPAGAARRNIGNRIEGLISRDAKTNELAAFELHFRERHNIEHHGNMASNEIMSSRRSAAIGHMSYINASQHFKLLSGDTPRRAITLGRTQTPLSESLQDRREQNLRRA